MNNSECPSDYIDPEAVGSNPTDRRETVVAQPVRAPEMPVWESSLHPLSLFFKPLLVIDAGECLQDYITPVPSWKTLVIRIDLDSMEWNEGNVS